MTEYELVSASAAMGDTLRALNEFGLTVLTGYLLIAFYIGTNLTIGQVSFVNIIFITLQLVLYFTSQEKADLAAYFESEALKLNPALPFRDVIEGSEALPIPEIITILVTGAALSFMWRVRHPRTE